MDRRRQKRDTGHQISNEDNPRRLRILLKKYKKCLINRRTTVEMKEPVVFLMRSSGKVEWYENAKGRTFTFTDDDDKDKTIILDQKFIRTFDYGDKVFKGYICDENYPLPLPHDPIITAEMFSIAIDKTLNDMKAWQAETLKAKGDMWLKILLGIGGIILAYAMYKMIMPDKTPTPAEISTVKTAGDLIISNASGITVL